MVEKIRNEAERPEDILRWTAKRRAALVLSILRGETSVLEAGNFLIESCSVSLIRSRW